MRAMRTHTQVIRDVGAAEVYQALQRRGVDVHPTTPQQWASRNSIPSRYWSDLVALRFATRTELTEAAAQRGADAP